MATTYREGIGVTDGAVHVSIASGGTIPSPTFTGVQRGNTYPIMVNGIPFIGLSSGSVAAGGGISGITALPAAYPNAYCYFPANILATSIAAGWYYCTFSTTTAGTAFLDTYSSGQPAIPSSPTAVTDGKGAFTGDTGEEFGPQITIPAGAMGIHGQLTAYEYLSATNNANAKTARMRLSGTGGTLISGQTVNSLADAGAVLVVANRGRADRQITSPAAIFAGTHTNRGVNSSIDTSAATTLVLSIQRATATDNFVLESFRVDCSSTGA